jgi:Fic family protein
MTWIWENRNWPDFTWNKDRVNSICREIFHNIGVISGKIGFFEKNENAQAELDSLLKSILTSSAIEGESLNAFSVRSSLAKRLKIKVDKFPTTARTEGLADLQFDVIHNLDKNFSKKRLLLWHTMLFPSGEDWKIPAGKFRGNTPMQVVSGRIDNPRVHFEAPPQKKIKTEVQLLLDWFNDTKIDEEYNPFVRAGIAHLWFVTIHPFEDGNGRLARALSELALAQYHSASSTLYSLSSNILDQRKEYYSILEKTQRGGLDITEWLIWFLKILNQSIQDSILKIDKTLFKIRFWQYFRDSQFLPEQRKILNAMFDSESSQFDKGISAKQYQKIAKVSKATATRHLAELVELGCIEKLSAGGRSTAYRLVKLSFNQNRKTYS